MNLKRRHLTESQRGMIAAKLANMPPHRPDINTANLQTSRADAAKLLNVSERTVNTAKKVEQNAIPSCPLCKFYGVRYELRAKFAQSTETAKLEQKHPPMVKHLLDKNPLKPAAIAGKKHPNY